MNNSIASQNLHQLSNIFDNARPHVTFFGGRYISNGQNLWELTEKISRCAQEWKQLTCKDRLIGLRLQRSARDFYVQIEKDLPNYNLFTRFFAYIRMFRLQFVNLRPGIGLYFFPEFHNKIDLFKRSVDWRSQSNFCVFTEHQLQTSFPELWNKWQNGDQSKIKEKFDPFEKIYSLDPNWLLDELANREQN